MHCLSELMPTRMFLLLLWFARKICRPPVDELVCILHFSISVLMQNSPKFVHFSNIVRINGVQHGGIDRHCFVTLCQSCASFYGPLTSEVYLVLHVLSWSPSLLHEN
jgi:hypothetical protein